MGNKNQHNVKNEKNVQNDKINKNNDYKTKINYKFNSNPNFKFKKILTNKNDAYGVNDVFEIYLSFYDNKEYVASPNVNNHNIDIFTLIDTKKINSLKGHKSIILSIRYFINNNYKEYLISSDYRKHVIIWEINNNFEIKYNINTKYRNDIYSCLMCFPPYEKEGYFITSTYCTSNSNENSATKIFSLEDGKLIRYINESNKIQIAYLLEWQNIQDEKYYIVQFAEKTIVINSLDNELYAKFEHSPENCHYGGYIDKEYLFTTLWNGYIQIWNLYTKKIFKVIKIGDLKLNYILKWNDKYAIANDCHTKSFFIIDLEQYKVISKICSNHTKALKSIKKILHPVYGESLLSSSYDKIIKIWSV